MSRNSEVSVLEDVRSMSKKIDLKNFQKIPKRPTFSQRIFNPTLFYICMPFVTAVVSKRILHLHADDLIDSYKSLLGSRSMTN